MTKRIIILVFVLCCTATAGTAQEIDFGQYGSYSLSVSELNANDLDFGYITSGGGLYDIDINNAKIVAISGVEYLDVIVEVSGQTKLYLNGNQAYASDPQRSIPFTLQAAYANNKGIPNIGQAHFITDITNNYFIKQIPLLDRQHLPPGPPPPPPTNAFEQSQVEETMYLYLYGILNVGNVNAGSYSSQITVTINYD